MHFPAFCCLFTAQSISRQRLQALLAGGLLQGVHELSPEALLLCSTAIRELLLDLIRPALEKQPHLPALDPAVAAHVNWRHVWVLLDYKDLEVEHRIAVFSMLVDLMELWRISHSGKRQEVKHLESN